MRTFVFLAIAVAVFAFSCASEDSDTGRAAVWFKAWLAEFTENLCKDVKAFFELLRVVFDLLNRANKYALEGYESYHKSTRIQKKWTWVWYQVAHQDTCKRVYFYGTIDNLTGLNGWKGVAEDMFRLSVKAAAMYCKLVQWYVILSVTLSVCAVCDRCIGWCERRLATRPAAPMRAPEQIPVAVPAQPYAPGVVPMVAPAPPTLWTRFWSCCAWLWQTWFGRFCRFHGARYLVVWMCVFLYHTNFFVRVAEVYMTVMDPSHDDVFEAWARGKNRTCLSLFLFGWLY